MRELLRFATSTMANAITSRGLQYAVPIRLYVCLYEYVCHVCDLHSLSVGILNGNLIRIACQVENKVEIEFIYFPLKSNGIAYENL